MTVLDDAFSRAPVREPGEHQEGVHMNDQPEEAEGVTPEDETSEDEAIVEVTGSGRILATVGPLGDGALERVRQS